jgi:hypothetical protein
MNSRKPKRNHDTGSKATCAYGVQTTLNRTIFSGQPNLKEPFSSQKDREVELLP